MPYDVSLWCPIYQSPWPEVGQHHGCRVPPHCEVNRSEPCETTGVNTGRSWPINEVERMAGTSEEEDQGINLQMVEDAVHSVLAFLSNTATQFSTYWRTKILEEYNKDLVSFSKEMEPELRAGPPLLFGSSFTKQAADHLGQVEALRKVKGKNKKVFSRPPCKGRLGGRGEQALSARIWREDVSCNSQEAAKMTINCTRTEGSVVCM